MNILFLAIPIALLLGAFFLGCFYWALGQGQFDDLSTPAYRILFEDNQLERKHNRGDSKP